MAEVEEVKEVTTVETATPHEQIVKTTKKVVPQPATYQKKKVIFRTYQLIWYVLGVIEVLLGFRIALKVLGANPLSGFMSFIYGVSDPFALPFSGILGSTVINNSVFEWSTFIAMLVYAVVAYGLVQLMQFIKPVSPDEIEQTVDSQ